MKLPIKTKNFLERFTRIILYHCPANTGNPDGNPDEMMIYKVRLIDDADSYVPVDLARYVEAWKVSTRKHDVKQQDKSQPNRLEFERYDPEAVRLIKLPHNARVKQAEEELIKYLTKPKVIS